MKQRIAGFLLLPLISIAVCAQASSTDSEELRKFELGFHFTLLERRDANTSIEVFRRNGLISPDYKPATIHEGGLGARFTYNLNKYIAFEAEVNGFLQDKRAYPVDGVPLAVVEPGGRKLQGLFGPKIGIRRNKFGVFGKVRPGFIGIDRYAIITEITPL